MRTFLLILVFSIASFSQSFTFSDESGEFQIVFPKRPRIESIYATGINGQKAFLAVSDSQLKVERFLFTGEVARSVQQWTDEFLASAAIEHGEDNAYENVSVATSSDKFGRYAKLQGFRTFDDVRYRIEIWFVYGKREFFAISVISPSQVFPTKVIRDFRDSFSFKKE